MTAPTPKAGRAPVAQVYKRDGWWRVAVRGEEQGEVFSDLISAHWYATFAARVVSVAFESIPAEVEP